MTETDPTPAFTAHRHTDRCRKDSTRYIWICPTDDLKNAGGGEVELVDTRDMLVFHAAASREFRLAPAAVGRVKPGDRKHAQDVDDYLGMLCYALHAHHDGEDKILWPVLRERLSTEETQLLDKIETQHADIMTSIERVEDARRRWLEHLDQHHRDALVIELKALSLLVDQHLDDEERDVLPLAAAYLSEAEWHAINEGGKAVLSFKAMLFVVGMTCYRVNRELTTVVLYSLSAPARLAIPVVARRMYVRHAARIHGTKRP
ncbi:hemerythrin domain-containing protein [Mycolicibacterium septicum]|uniref:hemerythrin domain-containing protein n=1 Tax=Mycolicibacterium septicum TaxID=98668 RepID=UPI002360F5D6|nr:hemerythrin domain-containing protein [Mycolicibacterium septicum]